MKGKGNEQHKYTRRKNDPKIPKSSKSDTAQLADAIHKSRATICKYENGDISMDIETLYEISQVLQGVCPAADRHRTAAGRSRSLFCIRSPEKSVFPGKDVIFLFL